MSLIYVHPDSLHDHWELVKTGLQRIQDRAQDRWKAEDVYHHLKCNSMGLYVQDSGKGFAILQPVKGWDGNELFIFAGYSLDSHDVVAQEIDSIKDIARNINAKRIRFQTKRKGWEKRAQEYGYTLGHVEYEIELTP